MRRILFVTDPMCSWCWGMTPAIEHALAELATDVEFDFLLGGINTHGTQPIGEYGRNRLFRLWREVEATTGQRFGYRLPEPLLYNSSLPCRAVHVVRQAVGEPPFAYLHRLQQLFFLESRNLNDRDTLAGEAAAFGVGRATFDVLMSSPLVDTALHGEFASARAYGTQALPSVLMETGGRRSLMAGGFVAGTMLVDLIERWPLGRDSDQEAK